jgi:hypothetical protein
MPYIGNTTTSFNVDSNNINNGSITTEKIAAGAVVNADVNDSASIAGTKISADFGAQNLVVDTSLLFVNATNDRVGIGTNSPAYALDVKQSNTANSNTIAAKGGTNGGGYFWETNAGTTYGAIGYGDLISANSGSSNTAITSWGAQDLLLGTNRTERLRIDSSGRLLVGTSTSRDNWFNGSSQSPVIQSESSSFQNLFSGTYTSSGNGAPIALLGKARGTSYQVVNDADGLGRISFQGADGAQMVEAAFILAEVDGTPGANDMPGRLVFSTTADGASSPTERMRIDASGNITLPSGGNLGINGALPQSPLDVISNASSYGISLRGRSSDNVSQFRFVSNNHGSVYSLFESALTYLATHVNGSERLRIDSSGRLLVGTSTSSTYFGAKLQVEGTTQDTSSAIFTRNSGNSGPPSLSFAKSRGGIGAFNVVANNDGLGSIYFSGADGTTMRTAAEISAYVEGTPGTNDMPGRLTFSTTSDGAGSPTERMRITADGTLLTFGVANGIVSGHSAAAGTSAQLFLGIHSRTSTTAGGTTSFQVFTNGNVQNTNNSYGAISDIKLKENIVDANSQWDDLKALQVRNYNFKEGQTHTQIGLVAQEVEPISSGLVYESPDRDEDGNDLGTVTKSVNYSVLYMKAVKALQEAMERIETLEAKVAALETP